MKPSERARPSTGCDVRDVERKMTGRLKVSVFDKHGKKVEEFQSQNVILLQIKYHLARLMTYGVGMNNYIDRMQFGTGTLAEAETDETLQSPITPIKAVTVAHPTIYTAEYTASLLADEANGFPISEAGLLTVDGTLVARKTFDSHTKDSSHIFHFDWTLNFNPD